MRSKFLTSIWALTMALAMPSAAQVTVAAAADLNAALTELAASYEKSGGGAVRLSFGSSGNLFHQIQNGAPFDVFFSADLDYPNRLIEAGLAEKSSFYRYAVGQLVLWVPASSPLDVEHRGMDSLLDPSVKKLRAARRRVALLAGPQSPRCAISGFTRKYRIALCSAKTSPRPRSLSSPAMPKSDSSPCRMPSRLV